MIFKLLSGLTVWQLLTGSAAMVILLIVINRVPLNYTIRNLTVRWKTTLLTGLAFTLVIGLLMVMLAFTNGIRRLTEGTGQPGNVLVLAEGSVDETLSSLSVGDLAEIENLPQVLRDPETNRPVASRETYMIVNQPIVNAKPGRPLRRFLQLRGIENPATAVKVHNVELLPGGSWFSEAGVQALPGAGEKAASAIQAVLGEGVAGVLAADRTPEERAAASNPRRLDVGDRFRLGERTLIVTGILKSSGSTFGSELWAKQSLVGPIFGKEAFTSLVLRTKDADAAAEFKEFLNSGYKKASVAAQVETDYYASLSETNRQFLVGIVFVTIVMAIGGVFGVANTMFAAISYRIKDIGILRILGFARWQILVSFLLESLLIAIAGGLLGCLLGSAANGLTATSMVGNTVGAGKFVVLQLVIDSRIWAYGIILTLAMGGIGGLIPAIIAMLKRPLEALR